MYKRSRGSLSLIVFYKTRSLVTNNGNEERLTVTSNVMLAMLGDISSIFLPSSEHKAHLPKKRKKLELKKLNTRNVKTSVHSILL